MRRLRRTPRVQLLILIVVGVLYSIIGAASHHTTGHNATFPMIFPPWSAEDFSAVLVSGNAPLTISDFTPSKQAWNASIDHAIEDWNSTLRSGATNINFDVLTRIGDNNISADIRVVTVAAGACGGTAWACADLIKDTSGGFVYLESDAPTGIGTRHFIMTHELGHVLAGMSDHSVPPATYNSVSVMGCCPPTNPASLTSHDNQDFHDLYSQGGQRVALSQIKKDGSDYLVAWEVGTMSDLEHMHTEEKFQVDFASGSIGGPYFQYGTANRNSKLLSSPEISVNGGEEKCFRVRTESYFWPLSHPTERYGLYTPAICIAQALDGRSVYIRSWAPALTAAYIVLDNQGSSILVNPQVKLATGEVMCQVTDLIFPGQSRACQFEMPWPTTGYFEIWYDYGMKDTIGYQN